MGPGGVTLQRFNGGGRGHTPPRSEYCEDNRVCHSAADPGGGTLQWMQNRTGGVTLQRFNAGGGGSHTATL